MRPLDNSVHLPIWGSGYGVDLGFGILGRLGFVMDRREVGCRGGVSLTMKNVRWVSKGELRMYCGGD